MTIEEFRPDYLVPGTRIGAYVVRTMLGQGGSGSVYEVQSDEGNLFALKICRYRPGPHGTTDWRMDRRCTRSIVCLEQLKGVRNVAEIFGHDRYPDPLTGHQYLVQELVPGSVTITSWVKRQAPSLVKIVTAFQELAELCGELAFADIRHRDLKPANILMAGDVPKVIDFDSAICFRPEPLTRKAASAQPCTRGYYSPELCRAILDEKRTGEADVFDYFPWSDLHALGVVFYECLTGEHPFDTSLPDDDLLKEVAYESPLQPMSLNPAVPFGLNKVVMRLLEKDPLDRYQHGDRVAEDLRTLLEKVADDDWTKPFELPDLDEVAPIRPSHVTALAGRVRGISTLKDPPARTPVPEPPALAHAAAPPMLVSGAPGRSRAWRRAQVAAVLMVGFAVGLPGGVRWSLPESSPAVASDVALASAACGAVEPSPRPAAAKKVLRQARNAVALASEVVKARPEDDLAWLASCSRLLGGSPRSPDEVVWADLQKGPNVIRHASGYEVRAGEVRADANSRDASVRLIGTAREAGDRVFFRFRELELADGRKVPICATGAADASGPGSASEMHPGFLSVSPKRIRVHVAPDIPSHSS